MIASGSYVEIWLERESSKPTIRMLKNMYSDTKINVRLENEVSDITMINQGVKQGCPASCVLFNI